MVMEFGSRMHSFGVVLKGDLTEVRWLEFLHEVTTAIGMSAVDDAKTWKYPLHGKGGVGMTVLLPITESFLALDTWPDHRGAYLFVCSCRPFDGYVVEGVARQAGLVPNETGTARFYAELNLT
jgi:hypothetical protein